ncbi:MAG: hypothetical protein U0M86_08520 [Dialister invisus]|uniref:hypothetical protein n=1 Tax=Dialister invisus TaxID=218538 RepID=UPI002F920E47
MIDPKAAFLNAFFAFLAYIGREKMQGLPYGVSFLVPCIFSLFRLCFSAASKKSLREQVQTGSRLMLFSAFTERGF